MLGFVHSVKDRFGRRCHSGCQQFLLASPVWIPWLIFWGHLGWCWLPVGTKELLSLTWQISPLDLESLLIQHNSVGESMLLKSFAIIKQMLEVAFLVIWENTM